MSIIELIKQVEKQSKTRTHSKSIELLKRANIIDDKGYYSEQYFSKGTIERDRKDGKAAIS
jgi:hypothetical protein